MPGVDRGRLKALLDEYQRKAIALGSITNKAHYFHGETRHAEYMGLRKAAYDDLHSAERKILDYVTNIGNVKEEGQ